MTLLKCWDTVMDRGHQVSAQLCQEIICEEAALHPDQFRALTIAIIHICVAVTMPKALTLDFPLCLKYDCHHHLQCVAYVGENQALPRAELQPLQGLPDITALDCHPIVTHCPTGSCD